MLHAKNNNTILGYIKLFTVNQKFNTINAINIRTHKHIYRQYTIDNMHTHTHTYIDIFRSTENLLCHACESGR